MSATKPLRIALRRARSSRHTGARRQGRRLRAPACGVVRPALSATSPAQPRTSSYGSSVGRSASPRTVEYRAHNGLRPPRRGLAPRPGTRGHNNPPLPLVISPHGRGGQGSSNATFWGTLPDDRRLRRRQPGREWAAASTAFSYGYRGQIDDLARMPAIVEEQRCHGCTSTSAAFTPSGSSMGGQETLLLVARHPSLLAGAAALDSVTDMDAPGLRPAVHGARSCALLQMKMRSELGGTPGPDARTRGRRCAAR